MMESTAHANRLAGYASALLDIARAEGDVDAFVDEFYSAAKTIAGTPELRETLTDCENPGRPQARDRRGSPRSSCGQGRRRLDQLRHRVGETRSLEEIASRVAELLAEHEGTVVAEVQSAVALDAGQVARLEAALSKATGKRVQAKVVTDPGLMGGVVAKIGDTIFDGSVKSRFADVREQWGWVDG